MKLFFTKATRHLAPFFALSENAYINTFSDGEQYLKLHTNIERKHTVVITSTIAPAEHIIELLLLLDALQRENAYIHLFFTYFGYARQDKAQKGEALGAQVILNCLKQFNIQSMDIMHVHNPHISQFLIFKNIIPYDFFMQYTPNVDIIIAPDKGAYPLANTIGTHSHKETILLNKIRPVQEKTKVMPIHADLSGKNVLIVDDMISTAETIINISIALKERGVNNIYVAATHGIFSGDAVEKLEESAIQHVFVTNTINQEKQSSKISVMNIAPFIQNIINEYKYKGPIHPHDIKHLP